MVLVGQVLDHAWEQLVGLAEGNAIANPELFSLIIILVVGFLGGRILSNVFNRLLKMTRLDDLAVQAGIQRALRQLSYHGTLSDFLASLLRWSIYFVTLLAMFYIFGSEFLIGYSELAVNYASKILLAIIALVGGVLISERLEEIAVQIFRAGRISGLADESNAEMPVYRLMGYVVKYLGYTITIIVAIGIVGVESMVLTLLIGLVGIGIVLTLILSTRYLTRNIAVSVYFQLSKLMKGGEHVRIGEYEGTVVGIRPLYTKIKDGDTMYYVPNTRLLTEVIAFTDDGE